MDEAPLSARPPSILFRSILLVWLAALSAGIVGAGHVGGWLGGIVAALVLGILGVLIAGLAGVPLPSTVVVMAMFAGLFEGILWGRSLLGWPGLLIGGVVGMVAAPVAGMAILISLLLLLDHFNPQPPSKSGQEPSVEGTDSIVPVPRPRRHDRTIGRAMAWILVIGLVLGLLRRLHDVWTPEWSRGLIYLAMVLAGCFAQARALRTLEDVSLGPLRKVAVIIGTISVLVAGLMLLFAVATLVFKLDKI